VVDEIIFEAETVRLNDAGDYKQDAQFINGLPNFTSVVREHIKTHKSKMVHVQSLDKDNLQQVEFHHFPPGSAIALRYAQSSALLAVITTTHTHI